MREFLGAFYPEKDDDIGSAITRHIYDSQLAIQLPRGCVRPVCSLILTQD